MATSVPEPMTSVSAKTATVGTGGRASSSVGNRLMRNPWWADVIIYSILFLAGMITLFPIWTVVVRSFSPSHIINTNPILLLPRQPNLQAYEYIFQTPTLMRSFGVTVYVTVVGTAINMVLTVMAAYGLSKTDIPGNRIIMTFIVIAMLFNAGIVPTYIVVNQLGLIDSLWALILPSAVSVFNLILLRNYFWSVPSEIEDSARIDGASDWQVLWRIVVPLSMPAIATIGLFYAVGHWNQFFAALFYINDNSKWPLQLLLRSIIIETNFQGMGTVTGEVQQRFISPENIKAASIVFATVPILMVYPFLQKYFVQGIKLGAIKG
jgi:putative aldouronate transport system permease protein